MKFLLFALILGFQISVSIAFSNISKSEIHTFSAQNIKDGWYEAIVSYYNPKTYTRSKYRLNVKVQYNRVVEIDFGNGGSVHAGYNNSGYVYSGGQLYFQRDYSGNIVSAEGKVTIMENLEYTYFDIKIE